MFSSDDPPGIKRFYTEKELLANSDKMKKAQQNEAPASDSRTLYERLQENKVRMEEEFAEKIKFRAPKGLDQEDIDFFEERARKRLIREIDNEEADLAELEKVLRAQRATKPEENPATPVPAVFSKGKQSTPTTPSGQKLQVKVVAKPKSASSSSSSSSTPLPSISPAPKRKHEEGEDSKAKKVQTDSKPTLSSFSSSSSKSSTTTTSKNPPLAESELGPAPSANPNPLGGLLAYDEDDDE